MLDGIRIAATTTTTNDDADDGQKHRQKENCNFATSRDIIHLAKHIYDSNDVLLLLVHSLLLPLLLLVACISFYLLLTIRNGFMKKCNTFSLAGLELSLIHI